VAFINALRLSRMTGDAELDERARDIYRTFRAHAGAMPTAFTQFLCGLDFAIGPASEVIIAGDRDGEDTRTLLRALRKNFFPNKIVMLRDGAVVHPDIETIAPHVQTYLSINGRATAYVCTNFTCANPVNDPDQMVALLMEKRSPD
jgi:hypothetical protein